MRPFVSQPCIRTGLISVFAIRGAYCPNSPLSSIPVTKLYKVLAKRCPISFLYVGLFISSLLIFWLNMRRLSILVTQNSRRIYWHTHQQWIWFSFWIYKLFLLSFNYFFLFHSLPPFFCLFLSAPPPQFQWLRSAGIREKPLHGLGDSLSSPPTLQKKKVSQFTSDL